MSGNQDRVSTWDKNLAIDGVLSAGGGIAVWTRWDETAPRAAVRHGTGDFVKDVTHLAALMMGLEDLVASIAKIHGVEPAGLQSAVAGAVPILREQCSSVTRLMPTKKAPPAGGGGA